MIKYTVLAIMAVVAMVVSMFPEASQLNGVKSGRLVLMCNDKVIDPERVVDFTDGRWYFDSGSMINCEVK